MVKVENVHRFEDVAVERAIVARNGDGEKTIHEIISASDAICTTVFPLKNDPASYSFISSTVFPAQGGTNLN